ncbi:phospholipase C/P1 nuclease [Testicularia cyperi]|uniref:Phospholipase C/P1 nuclease n=1 Tax=Testicularia cyperi TaxID=1882483 RepID=A0A317XUN4_9BASI|nr:phospholipase C/P1 nuclease [Testicularia cyperi]
MTWLGRAALIGTAIAGLLLSPVAGWGITGHQIVATIAQTQLHPAVREELCSILPNFTQYQSHWPPTPDGRPNTHCHLAVLAGWPDTIRFRYPWSGSLHYVNPVDDHPPQHCAYGETGWTSPNNVLSSLVNYTSRVTTETGWERDMAMRFVVHLFGDAHQPLHLTGRARGGNDIWVHFEGRKAKLHTVWDTLIIDKHIRELSNYTSKFPSGRIESALVGTRYDPYIRWMLKEGLGQPATKSQPMQGWWSDESQEWHTCSSKRQADTLQDLLQQGEQLAFSSVPDPTLVDDTDLPLCPYEWTKPMHPLVCRYAFASPVPNWEPATPTPPGSKPGSEPPANPLPAPELDVQEYLGRIDSDKVIQKQLTMAGLRLAAVLNSILLPA